MKEALGVIAGSVLLLVTFGLGALAGYRLAGEPPPPVILDEQLQRDVDYYRAENERLRREAGE